MKCTEFSVLSNGRNKLKARASFLLPPKHTHTLHRLTTNFPTSSKYLSHAIFRLCSILRSMSWFCISRCILQSNHLSPSFTHALTRPIYMKMCCFFLFSSSTYTLHTPLSLCSTTTNTHTYTCISHHFAHPPKITIHTHTQFQSLGAPQNGQSAGASPCHWA